MENQSTVTSSGTPPIDSLPVAQSLAPQQTKTNLMLPVLVTLLVSALLFGLGGYYFGKMAVQPGENRSEDQLEVVETPTPTLLPSSSPTVSQSPTLNWQSYTNQAALYEVQYPSGWRVVPYSSGEGYGPKEVAEDVLWAINFYDKADYTLDKIAAEFGDQFSDRTQTQQKIMLNGLAAIKYVTTTPSVVDWYLESIVIERGTSYIVISNGAITDENLQKTKGVASDTTFAKFYNSFHSVN